jgi:hypothetical protein
VLFLDLTPPVTGVPSKVRDFRKGGGEKKTKATLAAIALVLSGLACSAERSSMPDAGLMRRGVVDADAVPVATDVVMMATTDSADAIPDAIAVPDTKVVRVVTVGSSKSVTMPICGRLADPEWVWHWDAKDCNTRTEPQHFSECSWSPTSRLSCAARAYAPPGEVMPCLFPDIYIVGDAGENTESEQTCHVRVATCEECPL